MGRNVASAADRRQGAPTGNCIHHGDGDRSQQTPSKTRIVSPRFLTVAAIDSLLCVWVSMARDLLVLKRVSFAMKFVLPDLLLLVGLGVGSIAVWLLLKDKFAHVYERSRVRGGIILEALVTYGLTSRGVGYNAY